MRFFQIVETVIVAFNIPRVAARLELGIEMASNHRLITDALRNSNGSEAE